MSQDKELALARSQIKAGHLHEASSTLEGIININRRNESAWILLADCEEKLEDKIFCLREAVKINPSNELTMKELQKKKNELAEKYRQDYKVKIDELHLHLRENTEVIRLLERFLPKVPISIITIKNCYTLFEFLLLKQGDIGRKILWSSDGDLLDIRAIINPGKNELLHWTKFDGALHPLYNSIHGYYNEILSFIEDEFSKMKKLLQSVVPHENDPDYTFILLRLIQLSAPGFCRMGLEQISGIEFVDVKELSLEECAFVYFSKYKKYVGDVFEDPGLSLFTYLMIVNEKFGAVENIDYYNYPQRRMEIKKILSEKKEEFEYKIFEAEMRKDSSAEKSCTINDVDIMNGQQFEEFVAKIFTKMGYHTEITQHSCDFGVDIIAEKNEIKTAIQAKRYINPVPISAIQEIVAGMAHYDCQKGLVVTNSIFTRAAINLANSNSIQLWDRNILIEKLNEIF